MQHANGTANVCNLLFQIPTSVVTAGGIPTSAIGRSVANFSGHILKLVPGDFNYAFPLFPIVIIWNGETKFTPTQFTKANAICNWKLGIIDRHLSEAINLFEKVEGDLKNPTLNQSFNYLRCQVVETKQILGDRVKGISHTIPPVSYGPRSGTTSDLTYQFPKGYVPTPFIRHDIDPSVGDPQPLPPKSTQQSIAPPESETPAETPLPTGRLFLGFTPHPYWQQCTQDFFLPLDLPMGLPMVGSQLSSQLFRSQTQTQTQINPSQQLPTHTITSQVQIHPSQPGSSQTPIDISQPGSSQTPIDISQPGSSQTPIDISQTGSSQYQTIPSLSQAIPSSYPTSYQIPTSKPQTVPSRPTLSTRQRAPSSTVTSSSRPSSTPSLPPKKYKCKFCTYSTDRKNDWSNHCNLHTNTTFKCGLCSKTFYSEKNRTIHFKQVHLKQHRALCSVDKCNFSCNDFGIMKVHLFDDHGIGKEARCKDCNKKFGNYRVFERHIKICTLPKDKECPVCSKAYKDTERLATHMDTAHKGTPKLICDQCGKIFSSKDSIRVHKNSQHS